MSEGAQFRVYLAIATMDARETARGDRSILAWLKAGGHAAIARCPECGRAEFRHKRGCDMGSSIDMLKTLELNPHARKAIDELTAKLQAIARPAPRKHSHRSRSTPPAR